MTEHGTTSTMKLGMASMVLVMVLVMVLGTVVATAAMEIETQIMAQEEGGGPAATKTRISA